LRQGFLLLRIILILVIFVQAAAPEAEIRYFKQLRDVSVPQPDHQAYLVIDHTIWKHARPDLADLRLYDGTSQVPYQLIAENASSTAQEAEAKILNLAQHGDHTEFDLDVAPVSEYNRIHLGIDRKDFVITATVSGRESLNGASIPWPSPSTLFDFTQENLGSNSTIALPLWNFRYVHVRLSPGILPKDVKQATLSNLQEKKASWTDAGTCQSDGELQHTSVFTCTVATAVPIDRLQFEIPDGRVNFRRQVSVIDEKGFKLVSGADGTGSQLTSGTISRVKMNRAGTTAVSEDLTVNLYGVYTGRLTVNIDNGDDSPLSIKQIRPQSVERRVYFEPQGKSNLKLYYGDDKLSSPVYDYAKFFREDPNAVPSRLSDEIANPSFTARPDSRPWSEQHKTILWAAMLLAVAVLGSLAFRGLRAEAQKTH
jgi:hypothetical protein